VADLKNWPEHFVPLLAFMRSVLGIFHLVAELEEDVFDIFESGWWRFAVARCTNGRHDGFLEEKKAAEITREP